VTNTHGAQHYGNRSNTEPKNVPSESEPAGNDTSISYWNPDQPPFCALCDKRDPRRPPDTFDGKLHAPQFNGLCQRCAVKVLNQLDDITLQRDANDAIIGHLNVALADARGLFPGMTPPIDPNPPWDDTSIAALRDSSRNRGPAISELGALSEVDALPSSNTEPTGEAAEETPGPHRGRWQRTVARLKGMLGLTTGDTRAR
jgi:hypothetical protein